MLLMAKFNYKNGSSFVQLFFETTLEQISGSTPAGRNLLKLDIPNDSYIKIDTDGNPVPVARADVAADIQASLVGHPHSVADIDDLPDILAHKAPLTLGKISLANLPPSVIAGLKFKGALTGEAYTLGTTSPFNSLETSNEHWGYFWICGIDLQIIFSSVWKFENTDDTGGGMAGGGTMDLEAGDWIVYKEYSDGKYIMGIVNNTYPLAEIGKRGIVQLSSGSITKRGNLASATSGTKVIDEYALRQVMRDIHYSSSEPESSLPGDIWIQT
jgi:hypothetical protein